MAKRISHPGVNECKSIKERGSTHHAGEAVSFRSNRRPGGNDTRSEVVTPQISVPAHSNPVSTRRPTRKGVGPNAWGIPLSRNPLAFLLDTIEEAVRVVSEEGNVLFQNRAAHGARFEEGDLHHRRAMTFETGGRSFVIEVLYCRPQRTT
jgi:hypothetical protein